MSCVMDGTGHRRRRENATELLVGSSVDTSEGTERRLGPVVAPLQSVVPASGLAAPAVGAAFLFLPVGSPLRRSPVPCSHSHPRRPPRCRRPLRPCQKAGRGCCVACIEAEKPRSEKGSTCTCWRSPPRARSMPHARPVDRTARCLPLQRPQWHCTRASANNSHASKQPGCGR